MSTKTKTRRKSDSQTTPSGPRQESLIPRDILDDTQKRFEQIQDENDRPFQKPTRALLAQNSLETVEKRLRQKGVSRKRAHACAESVAEGTAVSFETVAGMADVEDRLAERILAGNDLIDVRFLLKGAQRTAAVGRSTATSSDLLGEIADAHDTVAAEDRRALDRVSELAHVARPAVRHESGLRLGRELELAVSERLEKVTAQ